MGYDQIRTALVEKSQTEWQLFLHPWEVLGQGYKNITCANIAQRVMVLQDTAITKEVRVWKKGAGLKFHNPVYEHIETDHAELSPIYVFSTGKHDYHYNLLLVDRWRKSQSLSPKPFYYQAFTLLALNKYDDFINASEHYMFLDTSVKLSTIMNRYYYAMVQIFHNGNVIPAFQNLNICIEKRPLMAEFWCLLGDAYYNLYNKYEIAKDFYENAIVLGSRRMDNDIFPMDISKYKEYPNTMINSCNNLLGKQAVFIDRNT
jgi:tetratricopeptide (TPR) repeat protein